MNNSNQEDKILIVDDAPETVEVIERNLSNEGFIIFTANK